MYIIIQKDQNIKNNNNDNVSTFYSHSPSKINQGMSVNIDYSIKILEDHKMYKSINQNKLNNNMVSKNT